MWQMIAAIKLFKFTQDSEYTPNELAAYKTGLAEVPVFLFECAAIIKEKEDKEGKEE